MKLIKHISIFLVVLSSSMAFSQVNFEVKVNKNAIGLNETIQVDFETNQEEGDFMPPDFEDFKVVGGPNTAISNSWINGEKTYKKTFTYQILPKKVGELRISKAQLSIDNKIFETEPLKIRVSFASKSVDEYRHEADVYLVSEITDSTLDLGQSTEVIYKLYVSQNVGIANWEGLVKPDYSDFTSEEIEVTPLEVKNEKFKNETYRYVVLNKVKLTSKALGNYTIAPLKLTVMVEGTSDKKDVFGNKVMKTVSIDVKSEPLVITVK